MLHTLNLDYIIELRINPHYNAPDYGNIKQ